MSMKRKVQAYVDAYVEADAIEKKRLELKAFRKSTRWNAIVANLVAIKTQLD